MSSCVADTHALVWYLLNAPELSPVALAAMQDAAAAGDSVYVPSIVLVELVYLIEKGRLPQTLFQRVVDALASPRTELKSVALDEAIAQTIQQVPRTTVPDMPDRIIAATAMHLNLPLVTRDKRIQASGVRTIW